ncbi:uncharacterized protein LOC128991710 [Macrosteles quadrilineatus]|uniref:uncharacterized protein LOC128991710 n=1 Tax=Macrosteles quadrilineatus TaxID=74068 RepID=UPI0023E292C7|nr:uncharacterized protein LOC128991710 [Macrosteles quadrilineatus]
MTKKLIAEKHRLHLHAGINTLVSVLRQTFWILRCRNSVKKIISRCVICKRHKGKPLQCPPPPLPLERISDSKVFETTGVDIAGPLFLKEGIKAYIVLFTCAVYRAIHLELTTSLSTEAFISALRRFVARRGRVVTIYSDNGRNFVGTSNLLRRINWDEIEKFSSVQRIKWKFNPPSAAWWGGWWERLIGVVKEILRRNLGNSSVTQEELSTILCDCEATVNSRPLTYLSNDDDCLQPLTPALFLQPTSTAELPDLDEIECLSLNKRVRYINKLRRSLRDRFKKEYLATLIHNGKNKKSREPIIGEVVLIGDDNTKRIRWPLGLVQDVYPGRDGFSRVARLKTGNGILTRPLQRLFPLEITACEKECLKENKPLEEEDVIVQNEGFDFAKKKTRCGREVKVPERFY